MNSIIFCDKLHKLCSQNFSSITLSFSGINCLKPGAPQLEMLQGNILTSTTEIN